MRADSVRLAGVAFLLITSFPALADVMSVKTGVVSASSYSSDYNPSTGSAPVVGVQFSHGVNRLWSLTLGMASTLSTANSDLALSGLALGATYEFTPWLVRTGPEADEGGGTHEITIVPNWRYRCSFMAGGWHYSNNLVPQKVRPGVPLRAEPVSADVYGIEIDGRIDRYLTNELAVVFDGNFVAALAQSFSINTLSFAIGLEWWY